MMIVNAPTTGAALAAPAATRDGFTVWLTGSPAPASRPWPRGWRPSCVGAAIASSCSTATWSAPTSPRASGYSREDRDTNIRRIGFVAKLLSRNGVATIVAAISPYRAVRDEVRGEIGRFVEVYVSCPLKDLVQRDVKGLYARALTGEIENFTGVSDPYEPPVSPEVVVETDRETVDESLAKILAGLEKHGYLRPPAAFPS
jgi:hypothetical protein